MRQLVLMSVVLCAVFGFFSPSGAYAIDCNANGIDDACDISCSNPGCEVQGCGQGQDCQPNEVLDECELGGLYAGTQGGEVPGAGKVFKYVGGTIWTDISQPGRDVAVVMSLAMLEGELYAATSSGYGTGGSPDGVGKVWRYDGGNAWIPLDPISDPPPTSVAVLLVHQNTLYAATTWRDPEDWEHKECRNGDVSKRGRS